ncbi:DEAD/DEAH box helicase [Virgibacillus sp. W0430]|uniref:DEAD/DEAH box helicase n=1 Tax=Virgibacillus sp. W0430 TaxID=3391580 RepID=UPI003F473447
MGRVLACEPLYYWTGAAPQWPKHANPCNWEGQLTDAQQSAANRIVQAIRTNEKEVLVWAVCGSGKTEMLFPGITTALQLGKRICIATPRADVVRELLPRLQEAFRSIDIQALYGGSRDKSGTAQLILSTTHQLLRYKAAFDVIIIDEIDAFPYHADPALPYATNRAANQKHTKIYLTATPRKADQRRIANRKLPHIFVPTRFHGHPLPVPAFAMCHSLKTNLKHGKMPSPFVRWLTKRTKPQRQILIFVPTIELAARLRQSCAALFLRQRLINTNRAITSVHSQDVKREEKVVAFRKKHLFALLTTSILERGVTFPSVDVVVLQADHNVFDSAALIQIAGRAGRSPHDPEGEVVFFHEGKTKAMVHALHSIKAMNIRGGFSNK